MAHERMRQTSRSDLLSIEWRVRVLAFVPEPQRPPLGAMEQRHVHPAARNAEAIVEKARSKSRAVVGSTPHRKPVIELGRGQFRP